MKEAENQMKVEKPFYSLLSKDKIKMNWNKNPIEVKLFVTLLTVPTERSRDHLGSDNGWTLLVNKELNLRIHGGIVNGTEYLDNIEYGKNLDNPYNNYVNPFYLFEILNDEGKQFFWNYYKQEIKGLLQKQQFEIDYCQRGYDNAIATMDRYKHEIKKLKP